MKDVDEARRKVKKITVPLFFLSFIVIGLMLFLPAGSFAYWQGWLFIFTLFMPVSFVVSYLLKHDPTLLIRRMQYKEKEAKQKIIVQITGLIFFIGITVPGLDYRYGWSHVPVWLVIVSNLLMLIGYILVFLVFKENSYTSRIVEVEKGQKVIATGPYSVIRHPMYAGVILMYLTMPLALGSYWAILFFIPTVPMIIFRALEEEKLLLKDLKGYREYCRKVKYRIIPGIW